MGILKTLFLEPLSLAVGFPGLLIICVICCAICYCCGAFSFIHSFGRGGRRDDDLFDEDLS